MILWRSGRPWLWWTMDVAQAPMVVMISPTLVDPSSECPWLELLVERDSGNGGSVVDSLSCEATVTVVRPSWVWPSAMDWYISAPIIFIERSDDTGLGSGTRRAHRAWTAKSHATRTEQQWFCSKLRSHAYLLPNSFIERSRWHIYDSLLIETLAWCLEQNKHRYGLWASCSG